MLVLGLVWARVSVGLVEVVEQGVVIVRAVVVIAVAHPKHIFHSFLVSASDISRDRPFFNQLSGINQKGLPLSKACFA